VREFGGQSNVNVPNTRGGLEIKLSERGEILPVSAAHAHLFKQF